MSWPDPVPKRPTDFDDAMRIVQRIADHRPQPEPPAYLDDAPPATERATKREPFYLPDFGRFPSEDELAGAQLTGALRDGIRAVLGEPTALASWRTAKPADWIVEGFLAHDCVTLLSARGGRGKSLLALDLLLRLAAGLDGDWLGAYHIVPHPYTVALLDAECGTSRLERRVRELVMGDAFEPEQVDAATSRLCVFPAESIPRKPLALQALPLLLADRPIDIVAVDPLRSLLPDAVNDENDNMQLGRVLDYLLALAKRFRCAMLVVDHDRKDETSARGAAAKGDAAEFVAHLTAPDKADRDYMELVMEKQRDPGGEVRTAIVRAGKPKTEDGLWPVRFERAPLRETAPDRPAKFRPGPADRVLVALKLAPAGLTLPEIMEFVAESEATVRRAIKSLGSRVVVDPGGGAGRKTTYFAAEKAP